MRKIELLVESGDLSEPLAAGAVLSRAGRWPCCCCSVHFLARVRPFRPAPVRAREGSDVILGILGLIDLAFTANLVLIVIFSGYENFVSRIESDDHDRPDWMTKVDFGGLKQKLMTSIVAISAIEVLKAFMNVEKYGSIHLGWLVGIHVVFLMSMLVVALSDKLGEAAKPPRREARGFSRASARKPDRPGWSNPSGHALAARGCHGAAAGPAPQRPNTACPRSGFVNHIRP